MLDLLENQTYGNIIKCKMLRDVIPLGFIDK